MKRNGVCMCGISQGGSPGPGFGMSWGPSGPRRKVNGNTSPGSEMNSPSPIWKAATSERSAWPEEPPSGATGAATVQSAL